MWISLALVGIAAAWTLMWAGFEPFPTWFYVFAWYPTLMLLDAISSRRLGREMLMRHGALVASMLAWSAVIWLLFEAANFRLRNWYYVFLPVNPVERWGGILLSFATVVPAVVLSARLFRGFGLGVRLSVPRLTIRPWELLAAQLAGIVTGTLALLLPDRFFPLIWGAVWLTLDPVLYRLRGEWSLIGDLERGRPGRIIQLLAGGALIGLLWEFYNYWARGKWIYTVPWLEELKLFEMPPFGFVGFPVFALEAWTLYHLLCALGVAVPPERIAGKRSPGAPRRRWIAAILAVAFTVATLTAMERLTISSTIPRLADLPGITQSETSTLQRAGLRSPFSLVATDIEAVTDRTGLTPERAAEILATVRLVLLRGIGTAHASSLQQAGIRSVCDLAAADPTWLFERHTAGSGRPTAAEVRVWVRAAKRRCASVNSG